MPANQTYQKAKILLLASFSEMSTPFCDISKIPQQGLYGYIIGIFLSMYVSLLDRVRYSMTSIRIIPGKLQQGLSQYYSGCT